MVVERIFPDNAVSSRISTDPLAACIEEDQILRNKVEFIRQGLSKIDGNIL